jgi:hypothetical protein
MMAYMLGRRFISLRYRRARRKATHNPHDRLQDALTTRRYYAAWDWRTDEAAAAERAMWMLTASTTKAAKASTFVYLAWSGLSSYLTLEIVELTT